VNETVTTQTGLRRTITLHSTSEALNVTGHGHGIEEKRQRGGTMELIIEGMTCGFCETTVQEALDKVDGVMKANVKLRKKRAYVTVDPEKNVKMEDLIKAVQEVGYEAKPV
jgi:copper chaperone CopZ